MVIKNLPLSRQWSSKQRNITLDHLCRHTWIFTLPKNIKIMRQKSQIFISKRVSKSSNRKIFYNFSLINYSFKTKRTSCQRILRATSASFRGIRTMWWPEIRCSKLTLMWWVCLRLFKFRSTTKLIAGSRKRNKILSMLIRREQNLIWMAVICWENEIKSKVMCRRCMGSDRSIWTYRATIITVGSGTCLTWSIRVIKWWNLTSCFQQTRHHWSWTTKIQILGFKTRCLWKPEIV